jgi:hypothetical protein
MSFPMDCGSNISPWASIVWDVPLDPKNDSSERELATFPHVLAAESSA